MARPIRLEPYRTDTSGSLHQGNQLHQFVKSEGEQFAAAWPDKVERYGRGIVKAARNVRRIGANPEVVGLWAYVIESDGGRSPHRALGIGTVTVRQAVLHPDVPERKIIGTDIDYVLTAGLAEDRGTHTEVARALLNTPPARRPNPRAGLITGDAVHLYASMRTTVAGELNPPYGMMGEADEDYWHPFGNPAPMGTPDEADPLGMAKGGRPLQLYLTVEDILNINNIHAHGA